MQTVIGVRFKKAGKIFYFSPGRLDISPGDLVIVNTVRGTECAEAVLGPKEVSDDEVKKPRKTTCNVCKATKSRKKKPLSFVKTK